MVHLFVLIINYYNIWKYSFIVYVHAKAIHVRSCRLLARLVKDYLKNTMLKLLEYLDSGCDETSQLDI